jgi:hypothetical protein
MLDVGGSGGAPRRFTLFAFGDDLLFLGVFGVAAVVPSGAALFFLRPYRTFWLGLSVAALVVARMLQ